MSDDQMVLVHVSDPHCSDVLLNSKFGWISGQAGHNVLLADALANAMDDVWSRHGLGSRNDLRLIMSGDLSRFGVPKEFDVGLRLFLGFVPAPGLSPNLGIGTGLDMNDMIMVPGNHDHWGGAPRLLVDYGAHNPSIFGGLDNSSAPFEPTPWAVTIPSSGDGFDLRLYGIDSNSGLAGRKTNISAEGIISSTEFARLDAILAREGTSAKRRLRVLVCHHPLCRDLHSPFLGALDKPSRRSLEKLVARHGIAAVLTGHTHRFAERRFPPSNGGRMLPFWERRSSTVMQGRAKPMAQGFFVHRLVFDAASNRIDWTTERYVWQGSRFALVQGIAASSEQY